MGQKVDARIFRQSLDKKNWEFKYIEKNNEESSLYLYKILQIKKYLDRFFNIYKIKIHNCKIFYSNNTLQIFISFYITQQTITIINKKRFKHFKILVLLHEFKFFKKSKRKKKKLTKSQLKRKKSGHLKLKKKKKIYVSKKRRKNCCYRKFVLLRKLKKKIKNKNKLFKLKNKLKKKKFYD